MNAREIRSQQSSRQLGDLLQSLFSVELLAPSRDLWLVSPWIGDIPILDNRAGQFQALAPEWDRGRIGLSRVLIYLAGLGTGIHVVTRDEGYNQGFIEEMREARRLVPGRIRLHDPSNRLHEKGILAERWYLEGSLNLTPSGISLNQERALLHVTPSVIAENRIEFMNRWPEEA